MELWQIFLGIAFFLAILTFTYPLLKRVRRRGEKKKEDRKEEMIKIIKEIKELKEEIEREEGSLTSISDLFLVSVQTLFEIRSVNNEMRGINERIKEMKAIIWFELGTLLALGLAIISNL